MEIEVGIQQLSQWLHAGSMDLAHFRVGGLDVFGVQLVPLLQNFNEILFPCLPGIEVSVIEGVSHEDAEFVQIGFTVEHVYI